MADNKFYRSVDRQITPLDAKQRIIDLMANGQSLPDAGIYDEPVRYFKANEKWCAILFGWLAWYEDPAGWPEAEDDNFSGIQQVLMFEEGIEPMVTQAEMTAAIHDGMYSAINDVAKQIVSGVTSGIVVDDDGNVTVGVSGEESLPEDDPETALNEAMAAKAGGAIAVRRGINNLLALLNTLYGPDAVADTTEADANYIISSQFKVDLTALAAAVTEYWADRAASKVQLITLDTLILDSALFCKGITKQVINTVIVQTTSVSLEARQNASALVNSLTDEQISDWFQAGLEIPSTAYELYTCTPIGTQLFTMDFSLADSFSMPMAANLKANHRYLLEAEGSFTDTDNPNVVKDFLWSANTSTGVKTYEGYTGSIPAFPVPSASEVPFQASHKYAFTVDKIGTDGGALFKNNAEFALPNTTGIITLRITDLGEF